MLLRAYNKKGEVKPLLYIFLVLFFGWILSQFILINQSSLLIDNRITGLPIDPLEVAGDFLSTPIGAGADSVPLWGMVLTFAMVFSILFILVKTVHLFKNDENRGPAIIFTLAASLLTVFATNIASLIYYFATTLVYFVVIVAIILIGWAGYLGAHTSISSGIGYISDFATNRYESGKAAKEARTAYFQTATNYDTAKKERGVLKSLKDKVYKKDKNATENLLTIFDNLVNRQLSVNQSVNRTLDRISRQGVPKGKKKQVDKLVNNIQTLKSDFESKVKEIRAGVEKVKSFIKANDFASAENSINNALNQEQDLERMSKQIAQKELEINRLLISP